MIYLEYFHMPSREQDELFFVADRARNPSFKNKNYRTVYSSQYPFIFFRERGLPDRFLFGEITVFCGGNGSGKSTILNVISETLRLKRNALYNRSDFFDDYVALCEYGASGSFTQDSGIITSDDVFDRVLDIRRVNKGVDDRRDELLRQWLTDKKSGDPTLHGLDDFDRWKDYHDAQSSKTQSRYLRERMIRNVEERSNGESALSFFVDSISDGGLYLLDEPENSLSPSNQLALKYFLEDCARSHACQFIISTHSPFLLSLRHARIYDIDSNPMATRNWTELDCVKVYHDFFRDNAASFDK